jgi:hypothetical protein
LIPIIICAFGLLLLPARNVCAHSSVDNNAFLDSILLTHASNHVEFKQISDTPITYRAWGVWNFDHSASAVAGVALDFCQYPRIFHYVYRCDRVTTPRNRVSPQGTWFVEGRAAIARVWAIGNIDSMTWPDSSHFRFIAHQNEDRLLEAKWYKRENGWINYRTHGVCLSAFIAATGHDSCRIAIAAQGWVKEKMPEWLISLATSIILPQLLQDLDKEITLREEARKPKVIPWYSRWAKTAYRYIVSNVLDSKPGSQP